MTIENVLNGVRIRTPDYTNDQRAEDDRALWTRIEQAEQRRAGLARRTSSWLVPTSPELSDLLQPDADAQETGAWSPLKHRLLQDLQHLCRRSIRAPEAGRQTAAAVDEGSPTDPVGARGLGCLFYLSGNGSRGARFWWRYAAGIGDSTAAYLLFLDALLRGRPQEALHCYRELHGSGFLCDEDWENTVLPPAPALRPAATPPVPPWPRGVGVESQEGAAIPEGHADELPQAGVDAPLCLQ
ncbi:hypothetical protein [Streptomyces syringium]|uniref:hypothetical protein n=1 Tax=Streptomyces syringium TaxID=76729 RepID=UPI003AAD69F8